MEQELTMFDVASMPTNSPTVHYPAKLHAVHDACPLVPEHVHIKEEMLSDTLRLMQDVITQTHQVYRKLVSNLR